jgi:hypothetical protein
MTVAEKIVEVIEKARAGRLDARTLMPMAYVFAFFLLMGLVVFILYVESRNKEGDKTVIDPNEEEEMRKFMEENGLGDLNDYNGLAKAPKQDDDTIIYGSAEHYDWQQSKTEMEVFIPNLAKETRGKDVNISITSSSLRATIAGKEIINGSLYAEVIPDECNWQIEEDAVTGDRKVWISLYKKEATLLKKMWPVVVQGDNSKSSASRVKTMGGVPMAEIDISDEGSMKEAIKQAKSAAARRQGGKVES